MSQYDEQAPSDLYDAPLDAAEAQEIAKRNMAPGGTYTTNPEEFGELSATPSTTEDGRRVVRFFGRCQYVGKGEPVVTMLGFRLSPDARPKKDREGNVVEGKDDISTRLYAETMKAYIQVHEGEAPKRLGDLVDWLKGAPLRLRVMQGDDQLVVLNVSNAGRR